QAEDGIRDRTVTGVQTCALPISDFLAGRGVERDDEAIQRAKHQLAVGKGRPAVDGVAAGARYGRFVAIARLAVVPHFLRMIGIRSEERRVGKECRSRWRGEAERE